MCKLPRFNTGWVQISETRQWTQTWFQKLHVLVNASWATVEDEVISAVTEFELIRHELAAFRVAHGKQPKSQFE